MGSSFHREGAAYLKERFVIFKEEWVGGRARVTIDEERVFQVYSLTNVAQATQSPKHASQALLALRA